MVNACLSYERKSKSVHIGVNTSKLKYAKKETKDEDPLVTDNAVVNVPSYFKLFEYGKNFLKT